MAAPREKIDQQLIDAIEGASLEAFGGIVNANAPGMIAVAQSAAWYGTITESNAQIIIDEMALFNAILAHGEASSRNPKERNAGISLWNAVNRQKDWAVPQRRQPEAAIAAAFDAAGHSASIGATVLLIEDTLSDARIIARLTVNRDVIDLRHIAMALLHQPPTRWSPDFNGEDIQSWRGAIAEPLARNHERNERIEIWPMLVTQSPLEIEQGLRSSKVGTAKAPPSPTPRKRGSTKNAAGLVSALPSPPAPPPSPPRPPKNDQINLQLGDPSQVDLLDRQPFADVLGDRINEVHTRQKKGPGISGDQAYIVHLHGPWGSGKSTILNFLRDRLRFGWIKVDQPEWLVVDFNAWKFQRLRPAWWALMVQIQRAAEAHALDPEEWLALRLRWLRLRMRLSVYPTTLLAITAAAFLVWLLLSNFPISNQDGPAKALTGIISLVSGGLSLFAVLRTLIAKSDVTSKAHAELAGDPYTAVIHEFEALVARIRQPVIVFIDDLDRCDAVYVADLLDNIQTMLRSAPITYLVAADRSWITTSFAKRYLDFVALGEIPARPLSYLFLDKLFQVSINMPTLSNAVRQRFLDALLGQQDAVTPRDAKRVEAEKKAAEAVVADKFSQEELQAELDNVQQEGPEKQALRVAAARRIAQAEVVTRMRQRVRHKAPQRAGAGIDRSRPNSSRSAQNFGPLKPAVR